jgi:hypothetical protein
MTQRKDEITDYWKFYALSEGQRSDLKRYVQFTKGVEHSAMPR